MIAFISIVSPDLITQSMMSDDSRTWSIPTPPPAISCSLQILMALTGMQATHFYMGIFHANVIYTGPGMLDYVPRKLEFLWVRWFQYLGNCSVVWKDCCLDGVRFPPTASDSAFGFVDPRDVLWGCHIMQGFAKGRVHPDGIGLSRCAADSNDWCYHYINRCNHHSLAPIRF